jgi:hypothetical protein
MPNFKIKPTHLRRLQERLGSKVPDAERENYQKHGCHLPKTVIHYAKTRSLSEQLKGKKAFEDHVQNEIVRSDLLAHLYDDGAAALESYEENGEMFLD